MSRVVILAINAKYVHASPSVWTLAGGVSRYTRRRHEVIIIESTIRHSNDDITAQVESAKPDIVGISVYIWNASKLPDIIKLLRKKLPGAPLILGGPEASHNAEHWLAQGADFILRGECERSLPSLLDALENNAPLDSIPGLCRKQGGETIISAIAPREDAIFTADYVNALNGRIAYLETSRGCPFRCAFCLSGGDENVRFFPLEEVKERLTILSRSTARTIKLTDRTFNCDAGRAYALFEHVINLDTECGFHFEVAADLFDERALSLLRGAPPGRIQLEAGFQSFYEPALKASSRQTDLSRAITNIRALLANKNIHIHIDLIAGLPYETLAHFRDSFNHAYELGAHTLQLGFLKLLHGSALREQAETLGIQYAAEPPYEITGSPWLSADDIRVLKQAENALNHTYNKGRFLTMLRYALSVSNTRPFSFYSALGAEAPNHATPLDRYARQVYDYCVKLQGVDENELRSSIIYDWLAMVKGRNMPSFLRTPDTQRAQVRKIAEKRLGRGIRRDETAVLPSGKGVYVDSGRRDAVTRLYWVEYVN